MIRHLLLLPQNQVSPQIPLNLGAMCFNVASVFRLVGIAVRFRERRKAEEETIGRLFASVFSDSEGEEEGNLIGELARDLFESTDEPDLFNFVAEVDGQISGSIFWTRMVFEKEDAAFILAPVTVRSEYQGKSIG